MFFLRKLFKQSTSSAHPRAPRARPQCEPLEDRTVPAVFVSGTTLIVRGDDSLANPNDTIRFVPLSSTQFRVLVNNFGQGVFSINNILRVDVRGLTGNDTLNATKSLRPVILQGGAGNDTLHDSRFSDLLIGSAGNDTLNSNRARDVLFGGNGDDTLNSSGAAGAILMPGDTNLSLSAVDNIRKRWNSSQSYNNRVNGISSNTAILARTFDDGFSNVLNGNSVGPPHNWYFVGDNDSVTGDVTGETITALNP